MEKYNSKFSLDNMNSSHARLISLVPDGSDVLELGCQRGFISKHLHRKGCKVTGIEIVPEAAEKAKPFCEKVIVTDIEKLDFKKDLGKKKYDVITFGDVLEHLKRPEAALEYVRDLLADDGLLLASIPNITFGYYRLELLKGSFNYENTGILDRTHIRFFDRNGVYSLFESAGYYIGRFHRIKREVSKEYVKDTLKEVGLDDSAAAVENLTNLLDFETLQYFVTAFPATEQNALKIMREKERGYITELKDYKRRSYLTRPWWKRIGKRRH